MTRDLTVEGLLVPGRLGPVDLRLSTGRLTVVLGPNGAGKSTLLGVLAGLVRPQEGRIRFGEDDLSSLGPARRAAHTAWLPQGPQVEAGVTALEAVAAARYRHSESWSARETAAQRALKTLGMGAFADRPMVALSGGEAQRVRLAALVAQEADWWLLDEPTNHLNPAVRLDLCQVLTERAAAGGSSVLVSHDLALLPHLGAARVVLLVAGRVAHVGDAEDPALAGPLSDAFQLPIRRVALDDGWALVVTGRGP